MTDIEDCFPQNSGYIANITTSFMEIPSVICSSVYLSGCIFYCQDCQNPELQNPVFGFKKTTEQVVKEINQNKLAKWVCFLGGEPFFQENFLYDICKKISKPIGIYTGNDFEITLHRYAHIIGLPNVKFLKTGKYIKELTCAGEFPITSNQKVYLKKNNIWTKCESRNTNDIGAEIHKS